MIIYFLSYKIPYKSQIILSMQITQIHKTWGACQKGILSTQHMAGNRTTIELDTKNAFVLVHHFFKTVKMELRTFWLLNLVQLHRLRNGSGYSTPSQFRSPLLILLASKKENDICPLMVRNKALTYLEQVSAGCKKHLGLIAKSSKRRLSNEDVWQQILVIICKR